MQYLRIYGACLNTKKSRDEAGTRDKKGTTRLRGDRGGPAESVRERLKRSAHGAMSDEVRERVSSSPKARQRGDGGEDCVEAWGPDPLRARVWHPN